MAATHSSLPFSFALRASIQLRIVTQCTLAPLIRTKPFPQLALLHVQFALALTTWIQFRTTAHLLPITTRLRKKKKAVAAILLSLPTQLCTCYSDSAQDCFPVPESSPLALSSVLATRIQFRTISQSRAHSTSVVSRR